jgi:hypothetical protein
MSGFTAASGIVIDGLRVDKATALDGAVFTGVKLSNAQFQLDELRHVDFFLATLSNVTFAGKLDCVRFNRALIHKSTFVDTTLAACEMQSVRAEDSAFDGVKVSNSIDAQPCTFAASQFQRCTFLDADLGEASLQGARFVDCDLSRASGLVFDNTFLRATVFSPRVDDRWSLLRRTYTGTNMVFTLIALVIYFLPFIFEATYWSGVTRLQFGVLQASEKFQQVVDRLPPSSQRELAEAVLQRVVPMEFEQCVASGQESPVAPTKCLPLWKVLMGFHEGWIAVTLALLLLTYNATRLALTWLVSCMRDDESWSWHTPPRKWPEQTPWYRVPAEMTHHYGWLIWPHSVVKVLFFVAVSAAIYHLGSRLVSHIWIGGM